VANLIMAIWALIGGFRWSSTSTFQVFVFQSRQKLSKIRGFDAKDYQIYFANLLIFRSIHQDPSAGSGEAGMVTSFTTTESSQRKRGTPMDIQAKSFVLGGALVAVCAAAYFGLVHSCPFKGKKYSSPDQPARFAAGKAKNDVRMLNIEAIYKPVVEGKVVLITGDFLFNLPSIQNPPLCA
jgi:hypothetical protein